MEYNVEIEALTGWNVAHRLALKTQGLKPKVPTPTDNWCKKMLKAMHSPLRGRIFIIEMTVPYWVSVHFSRHKVGVDHFVQSQRTDRTGEERDKKPQDAPVRHAMLINAEAIINISRKRLCGKADIETQKAWNAVVKALREVDPVLAAFCVPECIFRGYCPEFESCGRFDRPKAIAYREKYVRAFLPEEGEQ
jgi:hypothetical protein